MAGITAKPQALQTGHFTKEQREQRAEADAKMKGNDDLVYEVPNDLKTKHEKELYIFLVENLKASGILNNLDIELIKQTVFCIIQMENAQKHIKKHGQVIQKPDGSFAKNPSMNIYKEYQQIYISNSIRLGLSPADRAKLACLAVQQKNVEEDPLLKALKGDDDE